MGRHRNLQRTNSAGPKRRYTTAAAYHNTPALADYIFRDCHADGVQHPADNNDSICHNHSGHGQKPFSGAVNTQHLGRRDRAHRPVGRDYRYLDIVRPLAQVTPFDEHSGNEEYSGVLII